MVFHLKKKNYKMIENNRIIRLLYTPDNCFKPSISLKEVTTTENYQTSYKLD